MSKQSFDSAWRFHLGDFKGSRRLEPDDSEWRLLDLPHDWSIELPRAADNPSSFSGGYFEMGRAHYRKKIDAPAEWAGKRVLLEFEGVYMNAEVTLNRHFIGRYAYGYTTFFCDLTPYLELGKLNQLKVVVDNSGQLNSRWYSGSGIYRHVWLWVLEPVHIAPWGVYVATPEAAADKSLVRVRTTIRNTSSQAQQVALRSRLLSPGGSPAGSCESSVQIAAGAEFEFSQDVPVAKPQLWSPDEPHLYRVESEVLANGQAVDKRSTVFGIRSLHFSAEKGFLLNGQPLKMKGGCVHHDNGILGAASFDRAEERKVEIHKASGYNAIRCAHNPPAPAFLDACDRLGMLVIDEAFDCWRAGKNPFDYHVVFDDAWQRDLDGMLLRDRNHPSIVLWSIGNEVTERDGRGGGAEIARKLAERVRAADPTRPVISAINGVWDGLPWENTDAVFAHLDVGGYNYLWRQYLPDHQRHPARMMIGTESIPGEAFENWMSVLDHRYVLGDFVWTSLDYLGESGIGRVHYGETTFLGTYPWHQANCGDLDLCGFKRPQSFYRDILWEVGTQLYIAVHAPIPEDKTPTITFWGWPEVWPNWNWADHEGKTFKVDVYSACPEVELFLNGQSLGRKPATKEERFTASFDVPYAPGELKAVGYQYGEKMAETALKTNSAPARLRLTPDRSQLTAEPGSLSYVTVELLDEDGAAHPSADRMVYFTVKGAGCLLAVGSADPVSTENYRGNQRSTHRGRCLAVVQSNGQPGEIRLRAQADGLDGAEVVIAVK